MLLFLIPACVKQWQKLIKTHHTGFWCVWMDCFLWYWRYESVSRSIFFDFYCASVCLWRRQKGEFVTFLERMTTAPVLSKQQSSILPPFSFISLFLSPSRLNPTYAGCLSACQNTPYVYLCKSHHASPHSASVWVFNCLLQDVAVTCRRGAGVICVKWNECLASHRPAPQLSSANNHLYWFQTISHGGADAQGGGKWSVGTEEE